MAIDIEAVRAQQRELNRVSDEVSSVKRRLERHQEALDDAWKSAEIKGIDAAIEDIIRKLNRLAGDLEDLGHDVMETGNEIQAEEEAEARRRAEEEAARRQAEAAEVEAARRQAEAEQEQVLAAISRVFQKGNASWRK